MIPAIGSHLGIKDFPAKVKQQVLQAPRATPPVLTTQLSRSTKAADTEALSQWHVTNSGGWRAPAC